MNNMRVLIVGKSRRRIDHMIQAFGEHMTGIAFPRLFLFADRPTLLPRVRPSSITNGVTGKGSPTRCLSECLLKWIRRIRVGFLMRLFIVPAYVGLKAGSFANFL
jgi:hypothetical protein